MTHLIHMHTCSVSEWPHSVCVPLHVCVATRHRAEWPSGEVVCFRGRTLAFVCFESSCSLTANQDIKHIDRILCQSAIESIVRER